MLAERIPLSWNRVLLFAFIVIACGAMFSSTPKRFIVDARPVRTAQ
jgi:hypothetical protein